MSTGCSITAISWARVNLTMLATVSADVLAAASDSFPGDDHAVDVEFMLVENLRVQPIRTQRLGDGRYRLDLNVTNFHDRRQVPNGSWRIVAYLDGVPGPAAGFDLARVHQLEQDSRAFLYADNRVSYTVTFGISESDDPDLLMRTYQMFRPAPKKSDVRKPVATQVRQRLLPRARRVKVANEWYRLARRLRPKAGNRILFASEMRTGLEGNLLRVRDRMVERGLDKQYEFVYSFRVPRTATRRNTLRLIFLLATSDIVLIDDYFGLLEMLHLDPQTRIIQAWHAGSGFKNIGYSRFGNFGSPKLQNAHRKATYAITGSKHLIDVYAEAFGIEPAAVIPTGLPRIDTFLDPERTARVVEEFFAAHPQLRGKRIILFAPTFRGRGAGTAFYDYDRLDLARLYELCGADTVLLFRMHHFIRDAVPIPLPFADRLYDFTGIGETNDLLHVTDVLVTDYSSIIYEFSLLDRPMVFFAYDKEVYSATRGFHRDFDSTAPGKICADFDELVKAIEIEDYDLWKVEAFRKENFDVIDTHSADRVIDWLILGDPRTSELATSEPARRDPATGDTLLGADPRADDGKWFDLSDQTEAV